MSNYAAERLQAQQGTVKALTVRQPWAWLIFHGKDVENRDWHSNFTGTLAIHAGKGMTHDEYRFAAVYALQRGVVVPPAKELVFGAVLGTVVVADWVEWSPSPWFMGQYAAVLCGPRAFVAPVPCKGALGLWNWQIPTEAHL